jgi:agmatine/peptidylarginine deiminase
MAGLNIINNFVIVAHYDLCDEKNLKILKHMYPNKKVVAIPEKEALFIKDCDNIKLGKGIKIF